MFYNELVSDFFFFQLNITNKLIQVNNVLLDAITRVMYEVCEDAVNDGVKYLEVRFSPILHVNGNALM